MPRLLHLNGPPGIGKSTLARRYADDRPGVLTCDVDVLRTLVGGWDRDFVATGAIVRPTALAVVGSHLAGGRDVVLPQMIVQRGELDRFRAAAEEVGADYVHVLLLDGRESAVGRFHRRRGGPGVPDALVELLREVVAREGGDAHLAALHDALVALAGDVPTRVVPSVEGDPDSTYAALVAALDGTG